MAVSAREINEAADRAADVQLESIIASVRDSAAKLRDISQHDPEVQSRLLRDTERDYRVTARTITFLHGDRHALHQQLADAGRQPIVDAIRDVDLDVLRRLALPDDEGRLRSMAPDVVACALATVDDSDRARLAVLLTQVAGRAPAIRVWLGRLGLTGSVSRWALLVMRLHAKIPAGGLDLDLDAAARIDAAGGDAVDRAHALLGEWLGTVDELGTAVLLT